MISLVQDTFDFYKEPNQLKCYFEEIPCVCSVGNRHHAGAGRTQKRLSDGRVITIMQCKGCGHPLLLQKTFT